jgi:hypothetical protein
MREAQVQARCSQLRKNLWPKTWKRTFEASRSYCDELVILPEACRFPSPNDAGRGGVPLRSIFLRALFLAVALLAWTGLLPGSAQAQVLDTTRAAAGSTDYAVETYFVRADSASFFKPHKDEGAVRRLLGLVGPGRRCRLVTLMKAARQRSAAALQRRYREETAGEKGTGEPASGRTASAEVINVRLLLRCGPPRSAGAPLGAVVSSSGGFARPRGISPRRPK